ncbi:MAG: thiamine pyrophosphate-binding protein, partial [Elusimicrobia bacterium]|nr:thiamine pyrophosphate-binding protein [Elusimicrobiota bacterium]
DAVEDSHPLYVGRPNVVGDRAGNFAVQNADLLLSLGCRLNVRQISYNFSEFAREAFKIIVDIDSSELKKPTVKPDLAIHGDVADFLDKLLAELGGKALPPNSQWLNWCLERRRKYPAVTQAHRSKSSPVNPYVFVEALGHCLRPEEIVVCGDGSACVCTFQALKIGKGMRLYTNSGCASMGYDLPAAIGACAASGGRVVCLAGDGSIQMNLQELQTIAHHRLPVKIFWLNNSGYHSIRQTQHNFFGQQLAGCDPDSGVSFPDAERIALAYGLSFSRASDHDELPGAIRLALEAVGPALCEVVLDPEQAFEPRVSSRKLDNGSIVSAPLEDLYPFLDRKEFLGNMLIKPVQ